MESKLGFLAASLLFIAFYLGAIYLETHDTPEPNNKTVTFYCYQVGNAQAKAIKKKATGLITISHNGSIIQYKEKGITYTLTNAKCQFGLASENVVIK